jgi:hypothetical protein
MSAGRLGGNVRNAAGAVSAVAAGGLHCPAHKRFLENTPAKTYIERMLQRVRNPDAPAAVIHPCRPCF